MELPDRTDAFSSARWTAWGLRPIVLFAAAYTIIGIVHEWAHALTAYALKVPSTLFHLYVHLDRADSTFNERALIGVAGPLVCLGVGLVCWFAYKNAKSSRAELPLLYLAWFGSATFFGNLISSDFGRKSDGQRYRFCAIRHCRHLRARQTLQVEQAQTWKRWQQREYLA